MNVRPHPEIDVAVISLDDGQTEGLQSTPGVAFRDPMWGDDVRVFGSVARGEDDEGSDIDLLFDMATPLSLLELGRLERRVASAVGASVDLVPEGSLRPEIRGVVLGEAVAL